MMRRRRFIELTAATALAGSASAKAGHNSASTISRLRFHSTGSFYGANGGPLTDDAYVPVWAEDTASNDDADYDYDAFEYWDYRQIPLMAVDDGVVAFGSTFVDDGSLTGEYDNVQFLLNVWNAEVGSGTVLWDESNDQYWTLDRFREFEAAAEREGFSVVPTDNLYNDLSDADAAVITAPGEYLTDGELDGLARFVENGGTLFLHDQSDYNDYDATQRLDEICRRLGTAFQFNDDQVYDYDQNAGRSYQPTTDVFVTEFPYFDGDGGGGGGGGNEAPTASASVDDATVAPETTVTFDGTASVDADGTIEGYQWTFGDGTTATGATPTYTYDAAGSYDVTLTVTDDDGATATDIVAVTVETADGPDTTEVTIDSLSDGDTFDVQFDDGSTESIRVLGIDTPEKARNRDAERPPEWEGIESYDYLATWGDEATQFSKQAFDVGDTVEVFFDDDEDRKDPFGRLLAYVKYDATGDGVRDALYNRRLVEEGYARVYGSSLTKHDEFLQVEDTARANGTGLWAESDPDASTEIRDRAVDELFFPQAAAVTTASGALPGDRVPVTDQDGSNALVGVDAANNVAMVGGLTIDETYEADEGYDVDTSDFGNFPFLTNLLDALGDATGGDVLVDGGHGQFNSDAALSSEDAAYYQRYLEGQDLGFEQRNDLANADLSSGRALIVTTPASGFTTAEVDAVQSFAANGGAVVLMGSADGDAAALDDLAAALGTDLRLGPSVTDFSNNLNGDETVPVTSNVDGTFDLFGPYT
jgi:endonuclease YncB( thermonuclease family)